MLTDRRQKHHISLHISSSITSTSNIKFINTKSTITYRIIPGKMVHYVTPTAHYYFFTTKPHHP